MALKKSQLYSSLWSSCDELRGGMDASQYKDYVQECRVSLVNPSGGSCRRTDSLLGDSL